MYLYGIGMLLGAGFFIAIYFEDKDFNVELRSGMNSDAQAIALILCLLCLASATSWLSVIVMIIHRAYMDHKKKWN